MQIVTLMRQRGIDSRIAASICLQFSVKIYQLWSRRRTLGAGLGHQCNMMDSSNVGQIDA